MYKGKFQESNDVSVFGKEASRFTAKSLTDVQKDYFENYNTGREIDKNLKSFWVLTYPMSKDSTIGDILFECNGIFGFALQLRGGLGSDEIHMITQNKSEATKWAKIFIDDLKKFN